MIASAISSHSGQPDDEHERADDEVERPLHRPVPAGEHGRAQLEERHALTGHVLAALDEELGGLGREAHLDPLPVGLLDDLEHRALVERGLGEDHLVRPDALEDRGELGARAEPQGARDRCRRATAPTNSYAIPPRADGERRPEAREALSLPDEDDAPTDAGRAHDLERDRLVRGAEQADRRSPTMTTEVGMRPGGREVVAGADPEGEHDERDDDEAREDPPAPGRRSRTR